MWERNAINIYDHFDSNQNTHCQSKQKTHARTRTQRHTHLLSHVFDRINWKKWHVYTKNSGRMKCAQSICYVQSAMELSVTKFKARYHLIATAVHWDTQVLFHLLERDFAIYFDAFTAKRTIVDVEYPYHHFQGVNMIRQDYRI